MSHHRFLPVRSSTNYLCLTCPVQHSSNYVYLSTCTASFQQTRRSRHPFLLIIPPTADSRARRIYNQTPYCISIIPPNSSKTKTMYEQCPPGTYGTDPDRLVCDPCTGGYVCLGTTSSATPTSIDDDGGFMCTVGHYCPEGSSEERTCSAGSYNSQTGSSSVDACLACAIDHYQVKATTHRENNEMWSSSVRHYIGDRSGGFVLYRGSLQHVWAT